VKLIVSRAAAADIERLHAFLTDENETAAQRAVTVLIHAIQSLDTLPDRGRPSRVTGARELIVPFGQSAYIVPMPTMRGGKRLLSCASGTAAKRASNG
jgi:plasmid stabilization system protein ParE